MGSPQQLRHLQPTAFQQLFTPFYRLLEALNGFLIAFWRLFSFLNELDNLSKTSKDITGLAEDVLRRARRGHRLP